MGNKLKPKKTKKLTEAENKLVKRILYQILAMEIAQQMANQLIELTESKSTSMKQKTTNKAKEKKPKT